MRIIAMCLTAMAIATLGGCIIVPERHWHYREYGAAGTAPLALDMATGGRGVGQRSDA